MFCIDDIAIDLAVSCRGNSMCSDVMLACNGRMAWYTLTGRLIAT